MSEYCVRVSKLIEVDVPVEAESKEEARKIVEKLIRNQDWIFIFGGFEEPYGLAKVESVKAQEEVFYKDWDRMFEECEVVHPDGSHDWK